VLGKIGAAPTVRGRRGELLRQKGGLIFAKRTRGEGRGDKEEKGRKKGNFQRWKGGLQECILSMLLRKTAGLLRKSENGKIYLSLPGRLERVGKAIVVIAPPARKGRKGSDFR